MLHLYSAFLDTQSALHSKGAISSSTTNVQHPPATAAIVCQNAHHTPAYRWRGDRVMKPISVFDYKYFVGLIIDIQIKCIESRGKYIMKIVPEMKVLV